MLVKEIPTQRLNTHTKTVNDVINPVGEKYVNSIRKRVLDLLGAGILLPLTSPVILLCALAVMAENLKDPNYRFKSPFVTVPVMGKDGKLVNMHKIQTLRCSPTEGTLNHNGSSVYKAPEDNRKTRVGAKLRKTSLDELPQLIDILRGDFTFFGSRPVFEKKFRAIEEEIMHVEDPGVRAEYMKVYRRWAEIRMNSKSGTFSKCLYQGRGLLDANIEGIIKRMMIEIEEYENASLLGDVRVFYHSIFSILSGNGAF